MVRKYVVSHFKRVDPVLHRVLTKMPPFTVTSARDPFSDLIESVICQQLSEKAGATICGRLKALFPRGKITAKSLLAMPDKRIREVGPSWSKVSYIKNIARAVNSGNLDLIRLDRLSDEEVIEELVIIKGIGRWTAEMFLMFSLGREDVFSYGDLGLRRAIQKLYTFRKEPTTKQMEKLANRWKPYRTWAARILWQSLDLE